MSHPNPSDTVHNAGRPLTPVGLSRLGTLLAGLDRLDAILKLPEYPTLAEVGVAFGRFRLRARAGAGAYGLVLMADDPRVGGRRVAVKVPQPVVLSDPAACERFVREPRAAGVLDHPGIVAVLEAGEEGGVPYLVSGFVDGPTLAAWLTARAAPVPPAEAARLAAAVASAVQHAHERGILHCDLKPANVLLHLPPDGPPQPLVTDFGLARILTDDPALTRTFQRIGTPRYMSPEQAGGDRRALTARTDVYALGVILLDLLAGRPPDPDSSDTVRTKPTPPRQPASGSLPAGVPADLVAVCQKCLEPDPARRYPTAQELANDLDRFLAGLPTAARPLGPLAIAARWARRQPLAAGLAVVAVLAWAVIPALIVDHSDRLAAETTTRQAAEATANSARQAAEVSEFHAGLERVRQRRADPYPGWGDENLAALRELAAMPPAAATLSELRSETAAALAAVDLRRVRDLAVDFKPYAVAFTPDGGSLAVAGWEAGVDGVCRVRLVSVADGSLRRELTCTVAPGWAKKEDRPDGLRSVAVSPDGRWLAAGTRGGQVAAWDLSRQEDAVVLDAHSKDEAGPRDLHVEGLAFSDDSSRLYSASATVVRGWKVESWRCDFRHEQTYLPSAPSLPEAAALSRHLPNVGFRLSHFEPRSGRMTPTETVVGGNFALSPDGSLVFHYGWGGSPMPLISTANHTGFQLPLTMPGRSAFEPVEMTAMRFSPDGRIVATTGEHEGRIRLWDVAGGRLVADRSLPTGRPGHMSRRLAFSPAGSHLAVAEENRVDLYVVARGVVETVGVGPYVSVQAFAASPDGRKITLLGDHPFRPERADWSANPSGEWACSGRSPLAPGFNRHAALLARTSALGTTTPVELVRSLERPGTSYGRRVDVQIAPDGRAWVAEADMVSVLNRPRWKRTVVYQNDARAFDEGMALRALAVGRERAIIGRRDGRVIALDSKGGPLWEYETSQPVTAIAQSADEQTVVVGGENGAVRVLRPGGQSAADRSTAHRDAVRAVAVGPGGVIVTGSADRTVKIWDASLNPVLTLRMNGGVKQLSLSDDGRRLTVLVDGERAVRQIRLDTLGRELGALGLGVEVLPGPGGER